MDNTHQINELLEAYRPGVDNLDDEPWTGLRAALTADPALHARLLTQQRLDRAIRTAMHEVAIPAGLSDRLMSALSVHKSSSAPAAVSVNIPIEPRSVLPTPSPRFARRAIALGLGGTLVAAAAALLIAVWSPGAHNSEQVSAEELARLVEQWDSSPELRDADAWQDSTDGGGVSTHPLDHDVLVRASRWQRQSTVEEKSIVVYELARGSRKARLFVMPTSRNYLVSLTPCTALNGLTGGRAAGAWQRDGFLYVLVYDDRDSSFQDFVRVPNYT